MRNETTKLSKSLVRLVLAARVSSTIIAILRLVRSLVHLLYNKLYDKSTTNRKQVVRTGQSISDRSPTTIPRHSNVTAKVKKVKLGYIIVRSKAELKA